GKESKARTGQAWYVERDSDRGNNTSFGKEDNREHVRGSRSVVHAASARPDHDPEAHLLSRNSCLLV
ncbi:MAG: hypothetical protein AVDCRST_MAG93-8283, partial [uncultured Chloroflexia bacterium]